MGSGRGGGPAKVSLKPSLASTVHKAEPGLVEEDEGSSGNRGVVEEVKQPFVGGTGGLRLFRLLHERKSSASRDETNESIPGAHASLPGVSNYKQSAQLKQTDQERRSISHEDDSARTMLNQKAKPPSHQLPPKMLAEDEQ